LVEVETKGNWLKRIVIKSTIWGIGVGIGVYLLEFGVGILSEDLLMNSIGIGIVMVPLSILESFIVKKVKESRE